MCVKCVCNTTVPRCIDFIHIHLLPVLPKSVYTFSSSLLLLLLLLLVRSRFRFIVVFPSRFSRSACLYFSFYRIFVVVIGFCFTHFLFYLIGEILCRCCCFEFPLIKLRYLHTYTHRERVREWERHTLAVFMQFIRLIIYVFYMCFWHWLCRLSLLLCFFFIWNLAAFDAITHLMIANKIQSAIFAGVYLCIAKLSCRWCDDFIFRLINALNLNCHQKFNSIQWCCQSTETFLFGIIVLCDYGRQKRK